MTATTALLGQALQELQQHLTAELIAITIEQPGYAGFGVTTKAIIRRNVARWHLKEERRMGRRTP